MTKHAKHFYEFGPFRVDAAERVLTRDGASVPLTPKVFETLLLLVENRGRTVTKEEMIERLWPESFVEEGSLSQNIFLLRKAFGGDGAGNKIIKTVPKRGYLFVADVTEVGGGEADPVIEQHTRSGVLTEGQASTPEPRRAVAVASALAVAVLIGLAGGLYVLRTAGRLTQPLAIHPIDVQAYKLYLKGRYFWNRGSTKDIEKSLDYFGQAISRDQNFGPAYAGLADAYALLGYRYDTPVQREAMAKAKAAAERALGIDDRLAEAHSSLALVLFRHEWDWAGAEQQFKRAIELDPNYAIAHHYYGRYLSAVGRLDEAIQELRVAQELDPLSLRIGTTLAELLYLDRRYDEAIEQFRKTLELDPNFASAHEFLSLAYEQKRLYTESVEEALRARALLGAAPKAVAELKLAYEQGGLNGFRQKMLGLLQSRMEGGAVSPYRVAVVYASLGEKDRAFEWLDKAYQDRSIWIAYLRYDPRLDALRQEPRYQALVEHLDLPSDITRRVTAAAH